MSRRSERLKSKYTQISSPYFNGSDPSTSGSKDHEYCQSTTRDITRSKIRQGHDAPTHLPVTLKRRRPGALKQWLTEMPLDVLMETFSHLRPWDLLQLSRTTKALRAVLTSKRSLSVWKDARARNVEGLPECPEDLSEPAYASLLFESNCKFCDVPNSLTIIWECGIRCCQKCLHSSEVFGDSAETISFLSCTEDVWKILESIIPSYQRRIVNSVDTTQVWPLAQALRSMQEYLDLPTGQHGQWVTCKRRDFDARKIHAEACQRWLNLRTEQRVAELDKLRAARKESIIQRLHAEGMRDRMSSWPEWAYYALGSIKQVRVAKPLTDRIWQNIKEEVIGCVHNIQLMVDEEEQLAPTPFALEDWYASS